MLKIRQSIFHVGQMLAHFIIVVCLWTFICHFSGINAALLPTPEQVGNALVELCRGGILLNDVSWSVRRAGFGLIIGGTTGLLMGLLTGRIKSLNWLFTPVFNGFRAMPPVAIVPLVVVWAGLGEPAKVFITSWAAFFPVWLNTHAGVTSVDKVLIWAARSLGAKGVRLLFAITLPASLPQILIGFRLAISSVLICVIVAEMTGAYVGLGYRLNSAYLVFRVDRMLACLVVLALLGIVSDRLFVKMTNRVFPWIRLTHESR
ncbi:MAG: ABC transporter permease [Candidatus Methylumidiphilus sp.]